MLRKSKPSKKQPARQSASPPPPPKKGVKKVNDPMDVYPEENQQNTEPAELPAEPAPPPPMPQQNLTPNQKIQLALLATPPKE